jgi:hypothetical protein
MLSVPRQASDADGGNACKSDGKDDGGKNNVFSSAITLVCFARHATTL